jgi:hypothetical protein
MRRRESGRIAGILALLVLLAGIGVGAWYFLVYTKSPQYALNQFFAAAKANNTEKVEQYVDRSGAQLVRDALLRRRLMNPNMANVDPIRAHLPRLSPTPRWGRLKRCRSTPLRWRATARARR